MIQTPPESSPGTRRALQPSEALSLLHPPSLRSGSAASIGPGTGAAGVRYGFRCAGMAFLVRPRAGTEVIVPPPISALPGAPEWLRGMINLRGTAVPVFDLAKFAGIPSGHGGQGKLLVFGRNEEIAALVIDDAPERVRWRAEDAVALPALPEHIRACVTGASLVDDELWLDFDHEIAFSMLAHQ